MKDIQKILEAPLMPNEPWLTKAEQEQVVAGLLHYKLLRFDNSHTLPLKNGGTTDVYIHLRNARSNPAAIPFISRFFANALLRLDVERFAEIPDSVSCFAGSIAEEVRIPYVTIREEEKSGRVVKGKLIGEIVSGEQLAIIDDVVTDGASKIVPYAECRKNGVNPYLVVLVDREQGWRKTFAERHIDMPVWAGMTLHDVRYHLIKTFGVMERFDPGLGEKNPIIIALDGKGWDEYLPLLDRLRTMGCTFKINDALHQYGAGIVDDLSIYGNIMVDLKGHDIPNTVANISKHYLKNPPWAVTVHGSGGGEMVKAVVKAFEGTPTKVLVVTVLTSLNETDCTEIYNRLPGEEVRVLANIGYHAGAHGFVCSAHEVAELKKKYPEATLVVPAVRSAGVGANDQARVETPEVAMANGASKIVMGRQIINAVDPVAEMKRVLVEELHLSV